MSHSTTEQQFIDETIIEQGMQTQLLKWKSIIASGHSRIGWKIGFNNLADQRRMNLPSPIVGFLTGDRVSKSGDSFIARKDANIMLEAELAVLIGNDVPGDASLEQARSAIEAFAPAMELVDVARTAHDIASILEDNIFHEAVIFGESSRELLNLKTQEISARVLVNGEEVRIGEPSRYPEDISEFVCVVANTLAKQGQCLQAGDWIISGSITKPIAVQAGDEVKVELDPLGSITAQITG